ncbi:MAG: hypothetical protein M3388_08550 [Acidobacteriota bacterium]|nr:hypothetical protein [Acidobacteriota bacterium]
MKTAEIPVKSRENETATGLVNARGGKDVSILYTITKCSLGQLLVAATMRGLCAVSLGIAAANLKNRFWRNFQPPKFAATTLCSRIWLAKFYIVWKENGRNSNCRST